jgi:FtsZ-binding cell division protein ZapB
MEIVQERSIDSLASLEERITRAVQVITELRAQNASLTKRVAGLEEEVKRQANELEEVRGERKEVRTRIEKLLGQLDLLSAS